MQFRQFGLNGMIWILTNTVPLAMFDASCSLYSALRQPFNLNKVLLHK